MSGLGPVVLGAIAVFLLVLVSLVLQGRRAARARQSRRSDLGLVRVAVPDPVLTAGILSAIPPAAGTDYALAGLERVTGAAPGAWYVALVKGTNVADAGVAGAERRGCQRREARARALRRAPGSRRPRPRRRACCS